MNEVRATPVNPVVTRAATSQGLGAEKSSSLNNGNELPVKENQLQEIQQKQLKEATKLRDKESKSNTEDVKQAVTEINEYVQSIQRDLHFSVDDDSGLTVIRVRDKESGELIRQIPEDVFLDLAHKLKENQSLNLFDARG